MKRLALSIFNAWLLFVGVDFFFHAGVFSVLWKEEIPAIKPEIELAMLIPVGYTSFLLLTILIGYVFHKVFKEKPRRSTVWKFALIFGGLFALSNFLGLYSYVEIPLKQLVVFNVIYLIEITVVTFSLNQTLFADKTKKLTIQSIVLFIGLVILGVVFQNLIG